MDVYTGEALAFVNIVFNNNPYLGTVSDIDGNFSFRSNSELKSISFSYVGYEKFQLELDSLENKQQLLIKLKPSSVQLHEVLIRVKENPANRIIRKVIENKEINDPENSSSFMYTSYNKSHFDFTFTDSLVADSVIQKIRKGMEGGYIFLMESVTERQFVYPDLSEEVIIGTKVSGFKHPSFASLATDLQPFSFYEDFIPILESNYLNPISNGSLNKYNFSLKDTLYDAKDSVFVIAFQPKVNKNFAGLKGLLYINTNRYAIQNVIAEPFEKGLIEIKIQQKYQLIDDEQWFPEQLNYELRMKINNISGIGLLANGKSYIDNIELGKEISRSDFAIDAVRMHDAAAYRDSIFWESHRKYSLNEAEKSTYRVLDSLGEELNFDGLMRFIEKLADGKIPIGPIDLDLTQTLIYNDYEGYRWGFGASTNERISNIFQLGGFFGYGNEDHKWKYGGDIRFFFNRENEVELKVKHQNTLVEAGKSNLNYFNKNPYDLRDYMAFRMDRLIQNQISFSFRAFKYAEFGIAFNHSHREPRYDYTFTGNFEGIDSRFDNSAIELNFRYAFREKLLKSLGQRISMGTKYPVLILNFSRGIEGFYSGDFEYNKVEARIEKSFLTRGLGESKLRLDAGFIDQLLPYSLLYTAEGSFDKDKPYVIKNYFQTIKPYEFLSDRYLNVFFSHNFKSLLFEYRKFRPHLSIHQNMGWGSLSDSGKYQQIDFKTKDKGVFETGLIIDNILRINYLNVGYLGFGFGAFYRYGYYASGKQSDNFAFKFSMMFSTR